MRKIGLERTIRGVLAGLFVLAALLFALPAQAHGSDHSQTRSSVLPTADDHVPEQAPTPPTVFASADFGTGAPCHEGNHHGGACCIGVQCCPAMTIALVPAASAVALSADGALADPSLTDPRGRDAAPTEPPPKPIA